MIPFENQIIESVELSLGMSILGHQRYKDM